jgi:hypothetical protein
MLSVALFGQTTSPLPWPASHLFSCSGFVVVSRRTHGDIFSPTALRFIFYGPEEGSDNDAIKQFSWLRRGERRKPSGMFVEGRVTSKFNWPCVLNPNALLSAH